jgi:hypothetical protein
LALCFAIPVCIIGVIVAFARHDELSDWNRRIKVALGWPLEFWLKLKTTKAFHAVGVVIGGFGLFEASKCRLDLDMRAPVHVC